MRQFLKKACISHLLMGAVLAFALVVTMCPASAYASFQVVEAPGATTQIVSSQAGKVTVYVLTSTTTVNLGGDDDRSEVTKFSYRGGLLKKTRDENYYKGKDLGLGHSTIRRYDKKNRIVRIDGMSDIEGKTKIVFTYDAKGKLKKSKLKGGGFEYVSTYKYKSGRVSVIDKKPTKKCKQKLRYVESKKRTFSYKNGRLVKQTVKNGKSRANTTRFRYDSHGNLKWKNETSHYDTDGRLAQVVSSSGSITTYVYRPVKVSKSLVNQVKAQQWALVNRNLNLALGDEG